MFIDDVRIQGAMDACSREKLRNHWHMDRVRLICPPIPCQSHKITHTLSRSHHIVFRMSQKCHAIQSTNEWKKKRKKKLIICISMCYYKLFFGPKVFINFIFVQFFLLTNVHFLLFDWYYYKILQNKKKFIQQNLDFIRKQKKNQISANFLNFIDSQNDFRILTNLIIKLFLRFLIVTGSTFRWSSKIHGWSNPSRIHTMAAHIRFCW